MPTSSNRWFYCFRYYLVNDASISFGITFGKHRLFERISPKNHGKDFWRRFGRSGFRLCFLLVHPWNIVDQWLIFSEIIVIFGTFGDLIESLIKRTLLVKILAQLFRGMEVLLDRFDSMLLQHLSFFYLSFLSDKTIENKLIIENKTDNLPWTQNLTKYVAITTMKFPTRSNGLVRRNSLWKCSALFIPCCQDMIKQQLTGFKTNYEFQKTLVYPFCKTLKPISPRA